MSRKKPITVKEPQVETEPREVRFGVLKTFPDGSTARLVRYSRGEEHEEIVEAFSGKSYFGLGPLKSDSLTPIEVSRGRHRVRFDAHEDLLRAIILACQAALTIIEERPTSQEAGAEP